MLLDVGHDANVDDGDGGEQAMEEAAKANGADGGSGQIGADAAEAQPRSGAGALRSADGSAEGEIGGLGQSASAAPVTTSGIRSTRMHAYVPPMISWACIPHLSGAR